MAKKKIFILFVPVIACSLFQLIFLINVKKYLNSNLQNEEFKSCPERRHKLSYLKSIAFQMIQENSKWALNAHGMDETQIQHYKFSKFQLSMNHGAGFHFEYINTSNQDVKWTSESEEWIYEPSSNKSKKSVDDLSQCQGNEKINCRINMTESALMKHFPHFAQVAFPCFSALQIAKDKLSGSTPILQMQVIQEDKGKYNQAKDILLGSTGVKARSWSKGFYKGAERAGFEVSFVFEDDPILLKNERCTWIVSIPQNVAGKYSTGWPDKVAAKDVRGNDIDLYPVGNAKWFTRRRDMDVFQQSVLADEFRYGPSYDIPFRVLMINREGSSRHWIHSEETKKLLESTWNTEIFDSDLLDIKTVPNPDGYMLDQARVIHNADIIIASHGAALTNLAFIRPCTAVLELFPYAYYIGFFQPFVLTGEGISYDGYYVDGTKVVEASGRNGKKREVPLLTSPESILQIFPTILMEVMTCRENWVADTI